MPAPDPDELRRAEAHLHDVAALLPRLVTARGFGDADDIAASLHYRLTRATARSTANTPRLVAGLVPEATDSMPPEARQALAERQEYIEAPTATLLATALSDGAPWATELGAERRDAK
ncbi:hypothetical protein [Demequina maris]|uniref:hypothetical protein n=1 Tax=Demequina maris TaxID=1638982 RepID=UPI0007830B7D|nr:hypothetical protein [Demequina maris]